jgi:hypothetical protein
MRFPTLALIVGATLLAGCSGGVEKSVVDLALRNGEAAREGFERSHRFLVAWLERADPESGLIPRNFTNSKDLWNGRDAAADNYTFMVLTAFYTDEGLFNGAMKDMLAAEERLTSRLDRLPDNYVFSTKTWQSATVDVDHIIFEGAEYAKDGLITITEAIGHSEWTDRMLGIIDDVWKHAQVDTPFGRIPTMNLEVNGDLLQVCSRLYWYTGDRKYLEWAIRVGDNFLLGDRHPARQEEPFGFSDHGSEVINGLSELYVACAHGAPEKREAYRAPLHELYGRILEVALNEHGLFLSLVHMPSGANNDRLTDNWGYNFDGLYTAYLVDGTMAYRDAVRTALGNLLEHYTNYPWQGGGMDGYADSIEGAIALYNRERVPSAAQWIDSEIRRLWAKQRSSGVIEGWHCDGNFARTSLMYSLWKTQGTYVRPWRKDVTWGAVEQDGGLVIAARAEEPWSGKLVFDLPRHREYMRLPMDYPRINQFPEWFTVESNATYTVAQGRQTRTMTGSELRAGLDVRLDQGEELVLSVHPAKP